MLSTSFFDSDDLFTDSKKRDIISGFHNIVCILSVVLAAWYFLGCILTFSGALDDMYKFGGLGFSYPFYYYLSDNGFWKNAAIFMTVAVEFLLYHRKYRLSEPEKLRRSVWYFSIMLAFHMLIWVHANTTIQGYPSSCIVKAHYHIYANITLLPAITYFTVFLLRAWNLHSKEDI